MSNATFFSAVCFVIASAAATPARAQAAPAPAPLPASQPPPGGVADVSHINGVPVKVGEHNEYYYTIRRWNVSSNPLGWVMGAYGASVSYAVSPNIVLRADANIYHPVDSNSEGYEIGVGVPIYFRRAYQGIFLEPGFIAREMRSDSGGYHDENVEKGPQVLVGWHWSWDSGLNFAIAGGVGRNMAARSGDPYDGGSELFANGYMRFGYQF